MSSPILPRAPLGVLLVNLGSPAAPTRAACTRYLTQFLSDTRVITLPPILWQPLLRGIILPLRAGRTAHAYRQVWRKDGSPLLAITRAQTRALRKKFPQQIKIAYAMRYGAPSIAQGLQELTAAGCERVSAVALYPQYSATTTASVYDECARALARLTNPPVLRQAPPWHDWDIYIDALARNLKAHLRALRFRPDKIVLSFHGIPQAYAERGDPYPEHCAATARLLRRKMKLTAKEMPLCFQSRFGRGAWLTPYTDESVKRFAADGAKKILLVTPGFVSDCLETLEELRLRLREDFLAAGGRSFAVAPCLNASADGVRVLHEVVRQSLAGWR